MDWWIILWTALASAASAALSYAKGQNKKESWDWSKAGRSVALALFVSVAGSYSGLAPETIMASPVYAWLAVQLENGLKFAWRHAM